VVKLMQEQTRTIWCNTDAAQQYDAMQWCMNQWQQEVLCRYTVLVGVLGELYQEPANWLLSRWPVVALGHYQAT